MTRQHKKKKNPLPKGIPEGAIAADPLKQVSDGSYDPPPLWYVDKDFMCADCGTEDTWTVAEKKKPILTKMRRVTPKVFTKMQKMFCKTIFAKRLRKLQFSIVFIFLLITLVASCMLFVLIPEQRRRRAESVLLDVGKIFDPSDGSGYFVMSGQNSRASTLAGQIKSGQRQLHGVSIDRLDRGDLTIPALATATGLLEIQISTSDLHFTDIDAFVSMLPNLTHLRFEDCRIRMQAAHKLSSYSLESLEFINCQFEGLSPTKPFLIANVERVDLSGSTFPPDFLDCFLSCSHLEWISLHNTAIGDAAINSFAKTRRLKRIRIDGAELSSAGVTHLRLLQPRADLE